MRQKVKNRGSELKLGHFTVASLHQKKKQVLLMIKTLDQKPMKIDNKFIRPLFITVEVM
jgi:hypothetical protein